jgi:hypothetical protein
MVSPAAPKRGFLSWTGEKTQLRPMAQQAFGRGASMGTFTIFFDGQFWVGLATRLGDGGTEIARVVFGPEPSDAELVQWVRDEYRKLSFIPTSAEVVTRLVGNPKRRMREARRVLEEPRTRTRAQEAWSAALEETKTAAAAVRRHDRRAETDARYALRVEKRKQKHRGR